MDRICDRGVAGSGFRGGGRWPMICDRGDAGSGRQRPPRPLSPAKKITNQCRNGGRFPGGFPDESVGALRAFRTASSTSRLNHRGVRFPGGFPDEGVGAGGSTTEGFGFQVVSTPLNHRIPAQNILRLCTKGEKAHL
jgi:hypothetical protein